MPHRVAARMGRDTSRALEVWGDLVILSLYYMVAWAVCLIGEPYLHWTRYTGSPYLEARPPGQAEVWGVAFLCIALLAFHWQRLIGILAVLLFTVIRAFDLATAPDPGLVLVGGCLVFFLLAGRGTVARMRRYG